MPFIRKKSGQHRDKSDKPAQQAVFGCLLTFTANTGFNGLHKANDDFVRALIRYSRFREIHLFVPLALLESLKNYWADYILRFGNDKTIHFLSAHELPDYFRKTSYQVFHQGDPYIGSLAALRDSCAPEPFPITGRAHTLSTDGDLSRSRDLLLSPLKSCDAILCSSKAQMQVMKRLLAAASASITDQIGVAIPYKGSLGSLPLGMEIKDSELLSTGEAREQLGYGNGPLLILCLGRVSASDKMDLHPLLLAMNELVEGHGINNVQLVIAGAGDAGDESVQSLLRQAYALNLEGRVRFELSIEDERKQQLLAACDLFVSLADNIQESFGLAPLEAMLHEKPVILSDWNGYRELVEDGISGFLINTLSADHDDLTRHLGVLLASQAHLLQAQGTAVDIDQLTSVFCRLLEDPELAKQVGVRGRLRVQEHFSWVGIIEQYHQLVDTLGKEARQLSHSAVRPVGLPYHQVFGHYPSALANDSTCYTTTDRGVRILLKSEQGFYYSELGYLLNEGDIRALAERCLDGVTFAELKAEVTDASTLSFALMWMVKYQLLTTSEKVAPSPPSVNSQFASDVRLSAELRKHLQTPESNRFKLIEPVLCRLEHYFNEQYPDSSKPLLLNHFLPLLDEAVMQAVGWESKKQGTDRYADVLDVIADSGGLNYLAGQYPHWYRLNRRKILRELKSLKLLMVRWNRDLADINRQFDDLWTAPASQITAIDCPDRHSLGTIAILTFDNDEKLVYKNRDLRIDSQLVGADQPQLNIAGKVNQWLGAFPGIATHRILTCSDRYHYGYCQWLAGSDAELSEAAVSSYYRRMGVLCGFAVMTGLGDLHHLNVISCDGKPYIVDAQTAFHSSVVRTLEEELANPLMAFARGMDGSAFEKTGLWQVWETFHTGKVNYFRVVLDNGELVEAPVQQWQPVTSNCLKTQGRNSLDGIQPSLAAEYADQVCEGIQSFFAAVSEHVDEWQQLLEQCRGLEVRYQPMISIDEMEKQFWDLNLFDGFQKFSSGRLEAYFERMGRRLGLSGEEVLRWVADEWKEPSSGLSAGMVQSWLAGCNAVFTRDLGTNGVKYRIDGHSEEICADYFSHDYLDKTAALAGILKQQPETAEMYVNSFCQMIRLWLEEQLTPAVSLPDELRF